MSDNSPQLPPPGVTAKHVVGIGSSGICVRDPNTGNVIKIPHGEEEKSGECHVETLAYERLQKLSARPASILGYFGQTPYGIMLAYAQHGSILQYRRNKGAVTKALLRRWLDQATEALIFCHDCTILHADICCRNFFVDDALNLHLADFGGASIDAAPALVSYDASHRCHGAESNLLTVQTEIFAFGSFIYELVTGSPPHTLGDTLEYPPDVTLLPLGAVMMACWTHEFASLKEVRDRILHDPFFLDHDKNTSISCIVGYVS